MAAWRGVRNWRTVPTALTTGRRRPGIGKYDGLGMRRVRLMGKQSIRQQARRAALEGQAKIRAERAERDKRLQALAVRVLVAVRERDAAVAQAERHAGESLLMMTDTEGLSVREVVAWCGQEITAREVGRLRRAAEARDHQDRGEQADEGRRAEAGAGAVRGPLAGVAKDEDRL